MHDTSGTWTLFKWYTLGPSASRPGLPFGYPGYLEAEIKTTLGFEQPHKAMGRSGIYLEILGGGVRSIGNLVTHLTPRVDPWYAAGGMARSGFSI